MKRFRRLRTSARSSSARSTPTRLVAKAVAAKTKTLATTFGRKIRVRRYSDIRIVDTIKERS